MSDDDDLKVCPKCGWYKHGPYRPGECDPPRGKFVDEVFATLPDGAAGTKLGYGIHYFAVTVGGATLVFHALRDRTCALEKVYGMYSIGVAGAAFLAKMLVEMRTEKLGNLEP